LGLTENKVILGDTKFIIKGMYGEEIAYSDIKEIELTENLPTIKLKAKGFALGDHRKGYFHTDGQGVKLFISGKQGPFLKIKTKNEEIYLNRKQDNIQTLFKDLGQLLKSN